MKSYSSLRNLLIFALFSFFLFTVPLLSQVSPSILNWEKDIRALERLDSLETDPSNAILFAGSSSIRLWDSIQSDMAPWPVIQRGYGGAKLSDFEYYARRILYPHQPRAIALFIANDITGSEYDKTPAEVAALFKSILGIIREKFPETPVFWIQITPTPSRWKSWDQIREANRLIGEECTKDKACWLIQTEKNFLGPDGTPRKELFVGDQLHLSREGYKLWASIIKETLEDRLKKKIN
ncbi:MAG: GDSL-type esterase/lipase family protein [Bacteroidales bacterium]